MKHIYLFSALIFSVASYADAQNAAELQKDVELVKKQLHPQNEEVFCSIQNFENIFDYGRQKTGISEWQLDSVNTYSFSTESDSIDYTKWFYLYDENSNLTQVLRFLNYGQWGGTVNWRYFSKDEMEYDENGNFILETRYLYDIEDEVWVYYRKNINEYDEYKNTTLAKRYSWDEETGRWVGQSKFQYGYTSQGEITFMISNIWHNQSENWKPYWKREYAYHEVGYLDIEMLYDWDDENEEWLYAGKTEHEYDDSWNLIFAFGYDWDMDNEVYVPRFKAEREHNDENNVILHTVHLWDQDNNTWVGYWMNEYDYDAQGNMIFVMEYVWSIETGEWLENRLWEWKFDANGNMVLQIWGSRDNNLEQLVYTRKEEYIYNEEGYQALMILYDWSKQDNDWLLEFKYFYHYSEILVSAPFTEGVQVVLYPNPVREFINIEGMRKPDINIFDLSGTLILSRRNATTIDVSSLPSGVYLIKVTDDQNSTIKRFVKQ